jgi:hypothetical protein
MLHTGSDAALWVDDVSADVVELGRRGLALVVSSVLERRLDEVREVLAGASVA